MQVFKIVIGITLVALGLLWSLQGADLIQVKPILCVANCAGAQLAFIMLTACRRKHHA